LRPFAPVYSFKVRALQDSHLIIFLCVHHLFVNECLQVLKQRQITNKLTLVFISSIKKRVCENKNGYFLENVLKVDTELRNPHSLPGWMA